LDDDDRTIEGVEEEKGGSDEVNYPRPVRDVAGLDTTTQSQAAVDAASILTVRAQMSDLSRLAARRAQLQANLTQRVSQLEQLEQQHALLKSLQEQQRENQEDVEQHRALLLTSGAMEEGGLMGDEEGLMGEVERLREKQRVFGQLLKQHERLGRGREEREADEILWQQLDVQGQEHPVREEEEPGREQLGRKEQPGRKQQQPGREQQPGRKQQQPGRKQPGRELSGSDQEPDRKQQPGRMKRGKGQSSMEHPRRHHGRGEGPTLSGDNEQLGGRGDMITEHYPGEGVDGEVQCAEPVMEVTTTTTIGGGGGLAEQFNVRRRRMVSEEKEMEESEELDWLREMSAGGRRGKREEDGEGERGGRINTEELLPSETGHDLLDQGHGERSGHEGWTKEDWEEYYQSTKLLGL